MRATNNIKKGKKTNNKCSEIRIRFSTIFNMTTTSIFNTFFLVLFFTQTRADYHVVIKLNTVTKQDSSSYMYFENVDESTFYDRISLNFSTKVVTKLNQTPKIPKKPLKINQKNKQFLRKISIFSMFS